MSDLSVEILKQIRDELKHTREELSARLDAVREELSARLEGVRGDLSARLETTNDRLDRLEHRQTGTEIRLATELVAVVGAVHELRDAILEDRRIRETVANHETRIGALERKTG